MTAALPNPNQGITTAAPGLLDVAGCHPGDIADTAFLGYAVYLISGSSDVMQLACSPHFASRFVENPQRVEERVVPLRPQGGAFCAVPPLKPYAFVVSVGHDVNMLPTYCRRHA